MLPDVLDLDELNTGHRREGIFCALILQFQKMSIAIALFLVGKILDWAGFIPTTPGQSLPAQPESAMMAIRVLIGPVPALVLVFGLGVLLSHYSRVTWGNSTKTSRAQE